MHIFFAGVTEDSQISLSLGDWYARPCIAFGAYIMIRLAVNNMDVAYAHEEIRSIAKSVADDYKKHPFLISEHNLYSKSFEGLIRATSRDVAIICATCWEERRLSCVNRSLCGCDLSSRLHSRGSVWSYEVSSTSQVRFAPPTLLSLFQPVHKPADNNILPIKIEI